MSKEDVIKWGLAYGLRANELHNIATLGNKLGADIPDDIAVKTINNINSSTMQGDFFLNFNKNGDQITWEFDGDNFDKSIEDMSEDEIEQYGDFLLNSMDILGDRNREIYQKVLERARELDQKMPNSDINVTTTLVDEETVEEISTLFARNFEQEFNPEVNIDGDDIINNIEQEFEAELNEEVMQYIEDFTALIGRVGRNTETIIDGQEILYNEFGELKELVKDLEETVEDTNQTVHDTQDTVEDTNDTVHYNHQHLQNIESILEDIPTKSEVEEMYKNEFTGYDPDEFEAAAERAIARVLDDYDWDADQFPDEIKVPDNVATVNDLPDCVEPDDLPDDYPTIDEIRTAIREELDDYDFDPDGGNGRDGDDEPYKRDFLKKVGLGLAGVAGYLVSEKVTEEAGLEDEYDLDLWNLLDFVPILGAPNDDKGNGNQPPAGTETPTETPTTTPEPSTTEPARTPVPSGYQPELTNMEFGDREMEELAEYAREQGEDEIYREILMQANDNGVSSDQVNRFEWRNGDPVILTDYEDGEFHERTTLNNEIYALVEEYKQQGGS